MEYRGISEDNNRKIFEYLNPSSNDMMLELDNSDRLNVLSLLNKYYLELRNTLGVSRDITFGLELECDHANTRVIGEKLYDELFLRNWEMEPDGSLPLGAEIKSPVLKDSEASWIDLCRVCDIISGNASLTDNVGGHIHIGTQILGNNPKYWGNFIKLWTAYENVIFRFLYGEFISPRSILENQAKPIALDCTARMDLIDKAIGMVNASNLFRVLDHGDEDIKVRRKKCVNFTNVLKLQPYMYNMEKSMNTIEFRSPNGTFDPVIWQNNVNFLVKLMLYCKSDKFNEDIIDRRIKVIEDANKYALENARINGIKNVGFICGDVSKYSRIYYEQVLELVDLIFDNNLDKIYFLRQYVKDGNVSRMPLVRSEGFTRR